jgi:soluble lytic murein transglycosylase-like protein
MTLEAGSFRRSFLGLIFAFSAIVSAFAQTSGAFGLDAKALAALLAGQDVSPVLALGDDELADTGSYGPSAYYYLARWLDWREGKLWQPLSPEETRARLLYGMAYDRVPGGGSGADKLLRRSAGLAFIGRLAEAGLWADVLAFSDRFDAEEGSTWESDRPRLEALDALGRDAELSTLVERLRSAFPTEASREGDALSYFSAMADMRSGGKAWPRRLRVLLLETPASDWTARAFAEAQSDSRVRGLFREDEFHALAMRDAVRRKDYGRAFQEVLLAADATMGPTASRAIISDAGKAFLFSDGLADHESLFVAQGWTASFYKARFARALERWDEAASLFKTLASGAPTKADADAAAWYSLECSYRGGLAAAAAGDPNLRDSATAAARSAQLDGLVAAAASWTGPGSFLDLAGGLYRDALAARDWDLIEAMDSKLGSKLGYDMAARLSYTSCRAEELRPVPAPPDSGAEDRSEWQALAGRFSNIARDSSAPVYYRALAAWRAGLEPPLLRALETSAPPAAASVEAESYVSGLAGFGLVDIAFSEASARSSALGVVGLRALASLFSSLNRPDEAARVEALLFSRPDFAPRRSDYDLLYPRPYLSLLRDLDLERALPEALELGILRSESLFQADAVSRSGAIGLSQVMPATAAGQARAIGLSPYDLESPADNLAIGMSYFASLLDRFGGKPLRAMMAYNVGPNKFRSLAVASSDLPDDLLVEEIGIAETRQYCRNILQSTVVYGLLYYGSAAGTTIDSLVEGVDGDGTGR